MGQEAWEEDENGNMVNVRQLVRVKTPFEEGRCQATYRMGQCPYRAAKGSQYCVMHGGHMADIQRKKDNMANYLLTKYGGQLQHKTGSVEIKSLREEIGLLRMMIETKVNFCQDDNELLMHSQAISEMVTKVEKLVVSCHKIEASLGEHLDKTAVLNFANQIVDIIAIHVEDKDLAAVIGEKILTALGTILPGDPDASTSNHANCNGH